jgi:hypothetical protein
MWKEPLPGHSRRISRLDICSDLSRFTSIGSLRILIHAEALVGRETIVGREALRGAHRLSGTFIVSRKPNVPASISKGRPDLNLRHRSVNRFSVNPSVSKPC